MSPQDIYGQELDPECIHCVLAMAVLKFIKDHPGKSQEDTASELLQLAAEYVISRTNLPLTTAHQMLQSHLVAIATEWLKKHPRP